MMVRQFMVLVMIASLGLASPTIDPRQAPTIKQTVGTWQYKGCYKDTVPRIFTFRFDVPGGNSAERCTQLCASKGYGLAGMQYGSECWCDNYLPYNTLTTSSECNFTCPGDSTELCGAGSRMAVYQNSAATPPSTTECINWRDYYSFQNNILYATPRTLGGAGPTTKLFGIPTNPRTDPIWYTIVSTCPPGCIYTDWRNFGLLGGILRSYNDRVLPPVPGDSQAFISEYPPTDNGYNQYCAKPNPISSDGPFIGHPLLSVNGRTDQWSLCPNTTANGRLDIVYAPVANHNHYVRSQCQDVFIQITPWV